MDTEIPDEQMGCLAQAGDEKDGTDALGEATYNPELGAWVSNLDMDLDRAISRAILDSWSERSVAEEAHTEQSSRDYHLARPSFESRASPAADAEWTEFDNIGKPSDLVQANKSVLESSTGKTYSAWQSPRSTSKDIDEYLSLKWRDTKFGKIPPKPEEWEDFETARKASLLASGPSTSGGDRDLSSKIASFFDVFNVQNDTHACRTGDAMIIVDFPQSWKDNKGCGGNPFGTVTLRLWKQSIVDTGSASLTSDLNNPNYQRKVRREWAHKLKGQTGVEYVLDLTPSSDETDHSSSVLNLTLTSGIMNWSRCCHGDLGTEDRDLALVDGHDDHCDCRNISASGKTQGFSPTPVALKQGKMLDYCKIRYGANVVRLFRHIAGDQTLPAPLLDSAPRMWTMVGLFKKFGMTNCDILRDEVTTWVNAHEHPSFVSLLPEESLRVGDILKAGDLSERAFRILVNEHAINVAGGLTASDAQATTIFGRPVSNCFRGTESDDRLLGLIQDAGVVMQQRCQRALQGLFADDFLDQRELGEWNKLQGLQRRILECYTTDHPLVKACTNLTSHLRSSFKESLETILALPPVTTDLEGMSVFECMFDHLSPGPTNGATFGSFHDAYKHLRPEQKALTPVFWYELLNIDTRMIHGTMLGSELARLIRGLNENLHMSLGVTPCPAALEEMLHLKSGMSAFRSRVFREQLRHSLEKYIYEKVGWAKPSVAHKAMPHLLLSLSEEELDYLRLGENMGMVDDIPDTNMGPSGPGPAYHTGHTEVPSTDDGLSEWEGSADDSSYDGCGRALEANGSAATQGAYSKWRPTVPGASLNVDSDKSYDMVRTPPSTSEDPIARSDDGNSDFGVSSVASVASDETAKVTDRSRIDQDLDAFDFANDMDDEDMVEFD